MTKLLDLDELNKVDLPYGRAKHLDTYNYLLEQCHKKIKEYNKINRSKYCYYKPPILLTGKPMYNYFDMVSYLIEQLERNGLVARFLKEEGIFICWDPRVLNQNNYQEELSARQVVNEQEAADRFQRKNYPNATITNSNNGGRGRGRGKATAEKRPKGENIRMVNLLNLENDQFPVNI